MSLQKQAWSISAISVELDIDRRVLAKRLDLAEVRPIARVRGNPKYRLVDAIEALRPLEREPLVAESPIQAHRDLRRAVVRCCFAKAEPLARLLLRHTNVPKRNICDLIDQVYALFKETADAVMGETGVLNIEHGWLQLELA